MASKEEVKKNIYTSLKELGLTDLEADLYVISLALGPSPIAAIAEHLKMPRPNVYKVIAGLELKGLAKFATRKKYTRTFIVEPPTAVLEQLRQKREAVSNLDHDLVSAMPDLLALYHQGETPTKIRLYEGEEQYLKTFFSVLDEGKGELEFFGSAADFIGFISWEAEREWIKKRMKKGIRIKALLLPSKDAETLKASDAKEMRETRILKGLAPFAPIFQLYANKVIIWQPKAPLAMLIEDEYITQMLRSIFNALWEKAGADSNPS